MNITTKDLRKGAFAVGFGFVFGKLIAKEVYDIITYHLPKTVINVLAQEGNEVAQKMADELDIKYKSDETKKDEPKSKIKIGFTVD